MEFALPRRTTVRKLLASNAINAQRRLGCIIQTRITKTQDANEIN